VQKDSAGVAVVEVLHADVATARTIQFIVVVLFSSVNLLVHCVERRDFLGRKNFVVVLDYFLEFAGLKPFTLASRTDINRLSVVFNGTKLRTAAWTIHA
jgi:hypothetical protein